MRTMVLTGGLLLTLIAASWGAELPFWTKTTTEAGKTYQKTARFKASGQVEKIVVDGTKQEFVVAYDKDRITWKGENGSQFEILVQGNALTWKGPSWTETVKILPAKDVLWESSECRTTLQGKAYQETEKQTPEYYGQQNRGVRSRYTYAKGVLSSFQFDTKFYEYLFQSTGKGTKVTTRENLGPAFDAYDEKGNPIWQERKTQIVITTNGIRSTDQRTNIINHFILWTFFNDQLYIADLYGL